MDAHARKLKGNTFYQQRNFNEALKEYTLAAELAPNEVAIWSNIAAVNFETGNYAAVVQACETALEKPVHLFHESSHMNEISHELLPLYSAFFFLQEGIFESS